MKDYLNLRCVLQYYGKVCKSLKFKHKSLCADIHRERWQEGDWTDDSDQMILILQSLLDNNGKVCTSVEDQGPNHNSLVNNCWSLLSLKCIIKNIYIANANISRKEIFYLMTNSKHFIYGYMVKDHSDSEKGNPLLSHGLFFPISSKGSFICTIPQTG